MTFAVAANEKGEKVLTMSKEYIERQRAIVDACNSLELYPSEYAKLEDALNRIPAADVVEVVRCRECVHWKPIGSKAGNSFSDMEYIGGCEFTKYCRRESDFLQLWGTERRC